MEKTLYAIIFPYFSICYINHLLALLADVGVQET
jgi:hypothetical protein